MLRDWIKDNVYLSLFILTTVEGPITSFISAGIAAKGILQLEYVIYIAILGDIIGDVFLYTLGQGLHKLSIKKFFHKFQSNKKRLSHILTKRPLLYFLITKITPYLATPGLIYAGKKKIPFFKFLSYSICISILVKGIYITVGYTTIFTASQVTNFLEGWKQIAVYIIAGICGLSITKYIYTYIRNTIRK